MLYSSKILGLLLLLFLIGESVAEDPLSLLKKNRFLEAIEGWEKAAQERKMTKSKLRALKGQAMAYDKLGSLYSKFHDFFLVLLENYYAAIAKHTITSTLLLYQGQIDFYSGNYSMAVQKMGSVIKDKNASAREKDMAKVYRHHAMNMIRKKDLRLILDSKYPEVKWQMLQLDPKLKIPADLKAEDSRSIRNKLDILLSMRKSDPEQIEQMLKLILKKSEYVEKILNKGKLTQINFYDPMLLQTLSRAFYFLCKNRYLILLRNERKHPTLTKKFNSTLGLASSLYHLGQLDEAEDLLVGNVSKEGFILRARIKAAKKQRIKAKQTLATLVKNKKTPIVERDAGYAYFELGLDKHKALKLTGNALRNKKSSLYYHYYAAVLFGIGKKQDALEAYARGYKIQFRNSIEHINPEYMLDYTYAIFRTSKMRYDEVVETLYHIQKAYPACRQMYYCMQGIAAAHAKGIFGETGLGKSQ
jgi:tetratricopeptide (TPR) repeat protein